MMGGTTLICSAASLLFITLLGRTVAEEECIMHDVNGESHPFLDVCLRTCDKKRKSFDDPKAEPDALDPSARCEAFKCHSYCAAKMGCTKFWQDDCNTTVGLYHAADILKACDVDCSIAKRTCLLSTAVMLSIAALLLAR
eukprot:gnl/TRDRNA2_/TRDRNA2_167472_c0_seq5.p2 gnl/TRDRNA2_/TRDRNA2_167472_c0~~gnl/TRDRNA2_/TRDRNA2_167472_c0_seq5.p2  ORF type:complete len:140 (+),score=22.59 gnl/TRDRNA2_/TRDRNA2_167472_c0_seq5:93-512(+)